MQTKPNPSAHCSWVVSQAVLKGQNIFMHYFPWIAKTWRTQQHYTIEYYTITSEPEVIFLSNKPRLLLSITSSSTLLLRLGVWHVHFHWFRPKHSIDSSFTVPYHSYRSTKQTAADRWWIKTDEMGRSFRADGQRGDWVKGSCLIIWGIIAHHVKMQTKETFSHPALAEKVFYATLITVAVLIIPCPDWNPSWLVDEDLSEKEVIAHF